MCSKIVHSCVNMCPASAQVASLAPVRDRKVFAVRRTDRLAAILAALDADGSIDVVELADRLSVSAATLRRDLALLEEERLLARTHGGAVTTGVTYPLHNRLRDERRDLTAKACGLGQDAQAVGRELAVVVMNVDEDSGHF